MRWKLIYLFVLIFICYEEYFPKYSHIIFLVDVYRSSCCFNGNIECCRCGTSWWLIKIDTVLLFLWFFIWNSFLNDVCIVLFCFCNNLKWIYLIIKISYETSFNVRAFTDLSWLVWNLLPFKSIFQRLPSNVEENLFLLQLVLIRSIWSGNNEQK